MLNPSLDVITIGRSSVDLYGVQVGGRLEDMSSFRKYIGGSPTNIAAGSARLGLKSALITRVGDEHMGRFIREQLQREGVDTRGIITDPERLTALVLLGIRDEEQFPLIFYRENCADMALCEEDIDPDFIADSRCVTATGTHLSHPNTAAAVLKALNLARTNGGRTALDIDYRPNLWGLAGHGDGEQRFIASDAVTQELQSTLPLFDLIVGTEEEFHIAGGSTDTLEALRTVRTLTDAVLVCKRGPMGAVVFDKEIAASLDAGKTGPGFPIEVFNVLGAGDGFMSGLLRGWLRDETWETTLTWANACGAFAVSRHGCAPSYPSWTELQYFLENGSSEKSLRRDNNLEHIHWATNRRILRDKLFIFDLTSFDANNDAATAYEELKSQGLVGPQFGIIGSWDSHRDILYDAAGSDMWIGRVVDQHDTNFDDWPVCHCAVLRSSCKNVNSKDTKDTVQDARHHGIETMIYYDAERIKDLIKPDFWMLRHPLKLQDDSTTLAEFDRYCAGTLIECSHLNLESLRDAISELTKPTLFKGFVYKAHPSSLASVAGSIEEFRLLSTEMSSLL